MLERLKHMLGILGTGTVLSTSAIGGHGHAQTNSPDISKLNNYLQQLARIEPYSTAVQNNVAHPSTRDYERIAYGDKLNKTITSAQKYSEKLFDYNPLFSEPLSILSDKNLDNVPHREPSSTDTGSADKNGIALNTATPLKDYLPQTIKHETYHTGPQGNTQVGGTPKLMAVLAGNKAMYLTAKDFAKLKGIDPSKMTDEDITAQINSDQNAKMVQYTISALEIEPRLSTLKQTYAAMTTDNRIIDSPAETVRALQYFGFDLDRKVVKDLFEQWKMDFPEEAFSQKPLPAKDLREIGTKVPEIKDLKNVINGVQNYRDVRYDAQKNATLNIPKPKKFLPNIYKETLENIIFATPAIVRETTKKPDIGMELS